MSQFRGIVIVGRLVILCILLVPLLLLGCVTGRGGGSSEGYAAVTRFDPLRDADRDIADAIREADRSGRRVILDVGGEWCVWCRRLDSLFVQHPELAAYRDAHYVLVKVNWSPENKNEEVLARYPKVAGYPHLFVLDKKGALLHSQDTSELEAGKRHDPEKVLAFLRRWAS